MPHFTCSLTSYSLVDDVTLIQPEMHLFPSKYSITSQGTVYSSFELISKLPHTCVAGWAWSTARSVSGVFTLDSTEARLFSAVQASTTFS